MHLYKAQSNLNYSSMDTLDFWTVPERNPPFPIPRSVAVQLNIFAGQLYISSYEDYLEICKFLGLASVVITTEMLEAGWKIAADHFILSDNQGRVGGESEATASPVRAIRTLMTAIRRNGEGIDKTDIGRLLDGKLFKKDDFDRS